MPGSPSRFARFIAELRRRRVFRVAAFYGGIAFVVVQIIDGTFGLMGVPDWVGRVLVVLLILGFPVSMGLAWIFDITPEGIVRTEGRKSGKPGTSNRTLIAITLLAITFGVWGRWGGSRVTDTDDKSVAVLPFATFSTTDADLLFADGMTDNLITQLYKVSGLKVIGRTSVMQYKGTTKRLNTIGEELGVKTLLEGSVQRSTDRVIITAQLIDAESEAHLWAETYDRHITDIFDIQMEVARAIAQALKATLTPEVEELLAQRPTENMAAYDAYLRGIRWREAGNGGREMENTISGFEEATRLDPRFAEAWAELAIAHLFYRWLAYDASDDRLAQAEWALERANEFAPDRVAVRNARGRYHYHGHRDYARALQEFYPALQLEPNNPSIILSIAAVERRLGNFAKALEQFLRVFELDPRSAQYAAEVANTYRALADDENAARYARQAVALNPSATGNYYTLSEILYEQTGDAAETLAMLGNADPQIAEVDLLFLLGRYQIEARRERDAIVSLTRRLELLPPGDPRLAGAHGRLGWAYHFAGVADSAQAHWEQARSLALVEVERIETDMMERSPTIRLARWEALLGLPDQARRHADEAVAALPVSRDAWAGQRRMIDQAWVYYATGETGRAFEILEQVFAEPRYPGKKRNLVWRRWEDLRADPRYAALAAKYGLPE